MGSLERDLGEMRAAKVAVSTTTYATEVVRKQKGRSQQQQQMEVKGQEDPQNQHYGGSTRSPTNARWLTLGT